MGSYGNFKIVNSVKNKEKKNKNDTENVIEKSN